ncbi:MAG: type II toxin-antitoxin system VapC family toxin [Candidatus Thermoplasmatota archaeon]|nr:type II toxin-antitoxin system VapC family toxin [Candidatus Thermoplasmatota archaeon]
MASSYVLDSSSLFTLFFLDSEENVHKILKESSVLDLTAYEIGSILTKANDGHIRGLEREIILDLTKEIEKVIANIRVIRLKTLDIAEIMKLSLSTGLTFYDASYVFYCKFHQMALLTDDKEMYQEAMKLGLEVKKVEEVFN